MQDKTLTEKCIEVVEFLTKYPNIPPPSNVEINPYGDATIIWYLFGDSLDEQKEKARDIVRTIPGTAVKNGLTDLFEFSGECEGVRWRVLVDRPAVCERVVTSRASITKLVTDPEAPLIETTEIVETVEWICTPLLESYTAST